jgi:hypothetical protein
MKPIIVSICILVPACAFAIPNYSIKEGKKCTYCHYDNRGGGPTNARGRYYGKHHTFKGFYSSHKKKKEKTLGNASTEQ